MRKQQYALLALFGLIVASCLTSLASYHDMSLRVDNDMERALAVTMQEQPGDVIDTDTIRRFNSHLRIAALRGKATLAVDARSREFRAYARCSEATIFSLSDQRPAAALWLLTGCWALFVWYRRRQEALLPAAAPAPVAGTSFGGLTFAEHEARFYAADGSRVQLTPMQHQLLAMFFASPTHSLSKAEICEALWPKKPDASDTLYTLIRRLKSVVEQHSALKIASDRSKAYRLEIKEIEDRQEN